MKLEVNVRSALKQRVSEVFIKKTLLEAGAFFKKNVLASVSVNFVGDDKIRRLNRLYRHKDKATNVLSFSSDYKPSTANYPLDLGDIFISYQEVRREMKRYKLTLKEELRRLLVHGFLHLLGHDHEGAEEAKKMERIENKIIEKLNRK